MHSELKRRFVHVSGTAAPASVMLGVLTWNELRVALLAATVVTIMLEMARLSIGLDWRIFDELTREYEQENVAGYALYVLGITVVAFAFSTDVGVPAMLMLSIADPISGLLGSGELRSVKRAHILLVTFAVCVGIAWWFVTPVAALLGAVAATLADGAKPVIAGYVIDDNLTIPIGSAAAMALGIQYLPAVRF